MKMLGLLIEYLVKLKNCNIKSMACAYPNVDN